ncbi:U4/U6 small nuclear ribonucleoprotein Prp4-like isoform X2 [Hylaeus volcanicus]|uniref:U4/U6 small nuclear ribonucleoprotein Prp4-like isoform X2 n=1 Tax=Hylaeus volcanicus TaxID=313075 RepID=UPI0023B77E66|nr:U4/U6 small nuclear ribonucleoprotein Prp4-like isoform X2 [Hylaeus volcanicus]
MNDQNNSRETRITYGSIDPNVVAALKSTETTHAAKKTSFNKTPHSQVESNVPERVEAHRKILESYEMEKVARSVLAPTLDNDVKTRLREFGEPICLFGEGPFERRERLRFLLAKRAFRLDTTPEIVRMEHAKVETHQKLFFSEGGPHLLEARKWIARYSLPRSVKRLRRDRKEYDASDPLAVEAEVAEYNNELCKKLHVSLSQACAERPVCRGQFSPGSAFFGTASWCPTIRLWQIPGCEEFRSGLEGHTERVHGLGWSPFFKSTASCETQKLKTISEDRNQNLVSEDTHPIDFSEGVHLASGGADTKIILWSLKSMKSLSILEGHDDRVNHVEFHPSGRFLASSSHDETWRLWDVERSQELLVQEGHSTGVYSLKFHPDGSLILSGDLGGIIRGWDLRTGRSVFPLLGHIKQVLGISINPWRPNQVATCSDDNTIRIWDIRKQRCVDMILAHDKLISHVVYEPCHGRFLLSTSFDCTLKIWNATEYTCSRILLGHEARITGADISDNGAFIGSVSFDRTFKLWSLT